MNVKLIIAKVTNKNCSKIAERLYQFTRFCVQHIYTVTPVDWRDLPDPKFINFYNTEDYDYIFVIKAGYLFWNKSIFDQCLEEKTTKLSNEPVVGDENWFLIDCKKINTKLFNIEEYNIKPFSDSINKQKVFSFPETMYPYIEELMLDIKSPVPDKLKPFAYELNIAAKTLERSYYVINTEPVSITKTYETKFDNYIGVCGGLKTYILLGQDYFSENTKVLMFDISPAAIKWQRFLKKTWNGEVEYFLSELLIFRRLYPDYNPIGQDPNLAVGTVTHRGQNDERARYLNTTLHKYLKDNNIDAQLLKESWNKFQKMNVTYKRLDVFNTEDVNKLIQYTKLGTNTYFWLSNCFNMDRLIFQHGMKKAWDLEDSFKRNFRNKSYTPCAFDVSNEIDYDII